MNVLIATIGVNVVAWVALACAAWWQRTPEKMGAGDSAVAVGTSPISPDGSR